ncbi:hypothetical protein R1flu_001041 [Riccia fluitans]|uniref:Uncharacterized protein n=1 Tax=Riccia fluitans TaxID=41844 RepID=A0ABD1Y2I3_9MARC
MSGGSHSPNLGLLDQEASMQNIDRLIEALEMEARESRMSKHRKLFLDEPSSSALQLYQPPDPKEPSSSTLQVYQPFEPCLRKLVDFLVKGEYCRIGPPSEVEAEFLKRTGRKYKKDAWQDIAPWLGFSLTHSQPRSEGWLVDDFKKFSLEGHPDGYALDKQVWLVINQVQRMVAGDSDTRGETDRWAELATLANDGWDDLETRRNYGHDPRAEKTSRHGRREEMNQGTHTRDGRSIEPRWQEHSLARAVQLRTS